MKDSSSSALKAAVVISMTCASINAQSTLSDPYGICTHIARGRYAHAVEETQMMTNGNINWARSDFDWDRIEKSKGQWSFDHLDKTLELAESLNINLLPILDYDVAWARPAWKNLDLWSEYVQRTVSRYSHTLRYWEVWNEQNSEGFWRGDRPSGQNYAVLLKRSYEEIKKIDPKLTVLYGGTSGVPLDYIEDSLKAGAGDHFDIMNIHPYHWDGVPELMIKEIDDLRTLMSKYKVGNKPIWITEVGWSTALPPSFYSKVLPPAFRRAGIDPSNITAAVVNDPGLGFPRGVNFDATRSLPFFKKIEEITLAELKDISVTHYPVLVPSSGEEFPAKYIPHLIDYVKRGGTLLLPSRLPLYYDLRLDNKGGASRVQINDKYMKDFHIGWETWWTKEGVPGHVTYQKPAPGFDFPIVEQSGGRFLHDRNLKPGDEFIPVLEAGTNEYKGVTVALYKLNSDLKGNVIVCTSAATSETVPEARQAELLARTYLIALSRGVERIFWYNFRSSEWAPDEREAHFGIIRQNLDPKPAFHALRTLTELCPTGSKISALSISADNVYSVNWERPDGVNVWAIWTSGPTRPVNLSIKGSPSKALDHLGNPQPIPHQQYTANPAVLYLVGPSSVTIE